MFITKKKERLETMAKRIRAPAKILFGLRFKNRCVICGKVIPSDRTICSKCGKRQRL